MHRISLTWKIFLGTALVVATVLGATLALTARKATQAADASVGQCTEAAREQAATYLSARSRALRGGADVFVQNPNFRALVQEKKLGDVLDQSQEAASQLEADWVQITDADGVRLAKSDDPRPSPTHSPTRRSFARPSRGAPGRRSSWSAIPRWRRR